MSFQAVQYNDTSKLVPTTRIKERECLRMLDVTDVFPGATRLKYNGCILPFVLEEDGNNSQPLRVLADTSPFELPYGPARAIAKSIRDIKGEEQDDGPPKISQRYAIVSFVFDPYLNLKFLDGEQVSDNSKSMSWFDQAEINHSLSDYSSSPVWEIYEPFDALYFPCTGISEEDKVQRFGLFKGLKVAKFDWFIKLHFGNRPVIHVGFKASELDVPLTLHKKTNEPYFTRILIMSPGIQC
ncbi:1475_t:CDS:2 [Paraglomus brasilianum]|uniref:1475_t:CDS:1 n=1 Tax=Paraglomus brasilianum TaxID=144538 RepID=A0A9N9E3W9_9GLOM|nr:1475_t:CDS:2 [Paraglomus brasilianum]